MNKPFELQKSIQLLIGDFYLENLRLDFFQILVSRFKESSYNFVIPNKRFGGREKYLLNEKLKPYRDQGFGFSYYVPDEINIGFKKVISNASLVLDYTDLYPYKWLDKKIELEVKEVVKISDNNFKEFLEATEICFPEWENNREFTEWCKDSQHVEMLGVKVDGKVAAFGAYYSKPNSDYVLLMNSGTLPEFRRQGLHDYMIKTRINDVLESKSSACFYANVEDRGASHLGFKKLGFVDGPKFWVYKIGTK